MHSKTQMLMKFVTSLVSVTLLLAMNLILHYDKFHQYQSVLPPVVYTT